MVSSLLVRVQPRSHPTVVCHVWSIVVHDPDTTIGELHERAKTIALLVAQLSLSPARKET